MTVLHFIYSTVNGYISCFQICFCCRKYFYNILVHVSWGTWVRIELFGHKACACLILLGNSKLFPQTGCTVYIPISSVKTRFSTSLSTFGIVRL